MLQLVRLQQSEFFKRLISTFILICWESSHTVPHFDTEIDKILNDLIQNLNHLSSDIFSKYSCGKSLWASTQSTDLNDRKSYKHQEVWQLNELIRSLRLHSISVLSKY